MHNRNMFAYFVYFAGKFPQVDKGETEAFGNSLCIKIISHYQIVLSWN